MGVKRPVVPNLVSEADGVEEVEVHGGGTDDGHVGALLEVAAGLGRRWQRQTKVLGCTYIPRYQSVQSQSHSFK